jgi:hypothetical protein
VRLTAKDKSRIGECQMFLAEFIVDAHVAYCLLMKVGEKNNISKKDIPGMDHALTMVELFGNKAMIGIAKSLKDKLKIPS